jgi:radical SAM superfamily enzyme YgiQ (UPF0313 family)
MKSIPARNELLRTETRRPGFDPPGPERPLRAAVLYPQRYELGMSGLGVHFLCRALTEWEGLSFDRVFDDGGAGAPRSLVWERPLSGFHLIAATLPYEEDYAGFVSLLDRAGIPPLARERRESDPFVLAGGPAVSANPEPISSIADAAVLGDGEEPLVLMEGPLRRWAERGGSKGRLLAELAELPGLYCPAVGRDRVVYGRPADLAGGGAASCYVSPHTHFSETVLIEIARGCTSRCRFCLATQVYRSMRPVPDALIEREMDAWQGTARRIGFVAVSLTDHPRFADLLTEARGRGFEVSLSSLRVDSVTDREVDILSGVGADTLTLAPETGSDRLRRVVRKRVTNERILQIADALGESPIRNLKLYFLFGLPTETDEDLRAIGDLAREIRIRLARGRRPTRLVLSVNPLMAKPQTPFQFYGLLPRAELRRRARVLSRAVGREAHLPIDLKGIASALDQTAVALGDARVGEALVKSRREGLPLADALAAVGVDYESLVHGEKNRDHEFPWDFFLDAGRRHGFHREFLRALEGGVEGEPRVPIHVRRARAVSHEPGGAG